MCGNGWEMLVALTWDTVYLGKTTGNATATDIRACLVCPILARFPRPLVGNFCDAYLGRVSASPQLVTRFPPATR